MKQGPWSPTSSCSHDERSGYRWYHQYPGLSSQPSSQGGSMDGRTDANCPHVAMRVVAPGTTQPVQVSAGPVLMRRSGALSYDCGSCGRTLLDQVDADEATAAFYRCVACGAVNHPEPE